jgi:hypothetical protein
MTLGSRDLEASQRRCSPRDTGAAPDRSLTSARDIGQHPIKWACLQRDTGAISEGGGHIDNPKSLEVAAQSLDPAATALVGDQSASVLHRNGDLGRLVTGGRTQIQDAFPRLRIQRWNRRHRDLLLDMVRAAEVGDGLPR